MLATRKQSLLLISLVVFVALIAGCRNEGDGAPPTRDGSPTQREMAQESPTPLATADKTSVPVERPTATPLPTVTPTPTPTALPITLTGDPRALAVAAPAAQDGAVCGVVDLLDFPLDPPDAESITSGGQDFGRFRRRYDGYHAGEDWWGPSRRNSFGQPVYSIGHGQVTYAHPYGWGVDQGVVIIRHVLGDGRTFLSFYGHLDPPSVTLQSGECVERGDQVGEIGRPRSSPHLHFEIRTHTPGDPGPGYWSTDPTRSGWLPPSETIWSQRISVSPGVQWTRPPATERLLGGQFLDEDVLIMSEGADLVGLSVPDGTEKWRHTAFSVEDPDDDEEETVAIEALAMDREGALVYVADRRGKLLAFNLPVESATEEATSTGLLERAWDITFHNLRGSPTLIPLPHGGVAYLAQERMIGLSSAGALLWRSSFAGRPQDWVHFEEEVVVSAPGREGSLWSLNSSGPLAWKGIPGGALAGSGDDALLYDGDAVYRLELQNHRAHLLFSLSSGVVSQGDIAILPSGEILVAHMDGAARRLVAIDARGELLWERTYDGPADGRPQLLVMEGEPYLLSEERNRAWSRVSLYAISGQERSFTWLFGGGSRSEDQGTTWTRPVGAARMLLNIGGGSLVALNAQEAMQQVCQALVDVAAPSC